MLRVAAATSFPCELWPLGRTLGSGLLCPHGCCLLVSETSLPWPYCKVTLRSPHILQNKSGSCWGPGPVYEPLLQEHWTQQEPALS